MASGGQGSNDFFLNFGSDAAPFSEKLSADLTPGINKINALRTALEKYEKQAAQSKGGSSPLGLTFEGLDAAAERIEQATANFSRGFETQLTALTERVTGLREILDTAARNVSRGGGGGTHPTAPPASGPAVPPGPIRQPPSARIPATQRRGDQFTPEQLAILQGQRRAPTNTGQVTAAEKAAADKVKKASEDAAQATQKLADANTVSTDDIKATATALKSLNTQLKSIIETAGKVQGGNGNVPSNVDASVQIGNTTGNPVPVIVVGGEAQAAGGHPAPHHGPTPTATTATATAKAKEEVQAAAEVANLPNTRRNPTRVMPNDTVAPGQYFLLPGDDEKNPRRAYGLRPGETAGQYVGRVSSVQEREDKYLSKLPKFSDHDKEQLRLATEAYGPFPEPKSRVEPGSLGKSAQNQETVNGRALPKDVNALLRRRDLLAENAHTEARSFVLDELRRDPHMTQDGLSSTTKQALAQLDEQLLSVKNKSQAAKIFDSKGTPDLEALKEGATRRRYLADTGSAIYAEHEQSRRDDLYVRRQMYGNSRKEAIHGDEPTGHFANAERAEQSLADQAAINAAKATDEAKNAALANTRRNAQSRANNAASLVERLNSSEFNPKNLNDVEKAQRELSATTAPMIAELNTQIQRAQSNAARNRRNGNPTRAQSYLSKMEKLTALRDSFVPQATSESERAYREQEGEYRASRKAVTGLDQKKLGGQIVTDKEYADAVAYRDEQKRRLDAMKHSPLSTADRLGNIRSAAETYRAHQQGIYEDLTGETLAAKIEPEREYVPPPLTPEQIAGQKEHQRLLNLARGGDALKGLKMEDLRGVSAALSNEGHKFSYTSRTKKAELIQGILEQRRRYDIAHPDADAVAESVTEATAEPENVVEEQQKRSRRGGRPKQAESQAVAAVKEATGAVEQVKAQIHDLNSKLAEAKGRLARTRDGSQNNQKLAEAVAKLEQQKSELLEERKRLNREASNARRRQTRAASSTAGGTTSRSKSEQVDPNTPEGLLAAGLISPDELELVREHQLSRQRGALKGKGDRSVKRAEDALNQAIAAVAPENLDEFNPEAHDSVVEAQRKLQQAVAYRDSQYAKANQLSAGGNGNKPPTTPPPPAAATPEPEPEPTAPTVVPPRPRKVRPGDTVAAHQHQFEAFSEETQRAILEQRAALAATTDPAERLGAIRKAADAVVSDPAYANRALWGTDAQRANAGRTRALAGLLGLDEEHSPTRGAVTQSRIAAQNARELAATRGAAGSLGDTEEKDAQATDRLARMEDTLASASGRLLETRLALIRAENDLAQARTRVANTPDMTDAEKISALAPYEQRHAAAHRANEKEEDRAVAEQNPNWYARVTGRPNVGSLGQDLLRHGSLALTNTIGYSLVFSGFEKLREVMQTGIEVQAIFVRLQASLDANGIAAGNLQTKLGQISANTATPLEQVTEAAAELAGSFNNIGNKADRLSNIEFATGIASQLANISQGAMTAQQAAEGLRDVIYAYGDAWANSGLSVKQGLQQTGDQIAHLSQLTGVSVHDITQGTTQIAMEANEFGLSQRQASTLAAYITAGTGESGEQSASQASRMLATLYNGKTQGILERTYLYGKNGKVQRDQNGNPLTLATPQQFEQGKVGDVLANIAGNWDKLNPRQRQEISSMMGTGIQARAFSAFVGGGAAAAAQMNGSANDKGALNKQNQAYLNTVAGMIKQLDEDFQNLGSTLQRLGAFDSIGLLAKSLDLLLRTVNNVFGKISSFMNSNPITAGLMHWSTLILEAVAAWKLFGSAATGALSRVFPSLRRAVPTNQAEIDTAVASGARGSQVPRPTYAFGSVARAAGTGFRENIANRGRSFGTYWGGVASRDATTGRRNWADLTPAGIGAHSAVMTTQTAEARAIETRTKAEAEATAAAERVVAAETAEREASARLATAEQEGATAENELNTLRADQASANEDLIAATANATRAQEALALAAGAAAVANEEAAAAAQAQAGIRGAGFMASMRGMGGRLGMGLAMGSLLLAGPVSHAISGGEGAGDGVRGYLGSATSGLMYGAGIGGMVGGPLGAAVGAGIGGIYGAGKAIFAAKAKMDAIPSDASDNQYIALLNQLYRSGDPKSKLALKNAKKTLGYGPATNIGIDQLDQITSADDLKKWEKEQKRFIAKHAKDIEKAGGNNSTAQKAIKQQIDQLRHNLEKDADRRLAELEGLNKIDQLTANQVQALGQVSGQVGSLSTETLANQSGAVTTMLQNSGLPTGSAAYKDLLAATNTGGPINTLGINDKGQIGQYSADGTWHQASKQQEAGIGPTEGSHLAQLGAGPKAGGLAYGRLTALRGAYQQIIDNAKAKLDDPANLNPQDLQTSLQNLNTGLTGWQQMNQQIYTMPITQEQGQGNMLAALGGTPGVAKSLGLGGGGNAAAVAQLTAANVDIKKYNDTLDKTDPQYWSNLQQIQQNKLQIAQLQASPEINRLLLAAAEATDATSQADIKYQQAVDQLNLDKKAGASTATLGQDRANIAASGVGQKQATESVAQAQAAANSAGIRNNIQKAQADYNEALRLEGVYAKGGSLADQASYLRAVAQAEQAQIAIQDAVESRVQSAYDATAAWQRLDGHPLAAATTALAKAQQAYRDAVAKYHEGSQQANAASAQVAQAEMDRRQLIEADKQSTFDAKAAFDKLHGDDVGAAMEAWAKAKQAYAFAVRDYGKGSSQANAALAAATQAQQDAIQAQLDQVNSWLDLDAALATARGQKGDPEKAANDAVAKVRNQINSYLRRGGKKGTKQYNELMGQLATAQRSAFDTQLQDQLDTLDFQQQTYKITSSQEIQALQQILKNKQLTLAEQRSITLKIKNLQDSIRQELTQGGLNIPSDIKLPTAYEVRRSIGAGFSGGGTQVNTVNNNQQVTVNNNVPNSQVASQIASQVIQLINQQTSMGLRASSSTPRNVQTK